MAQYQVMSHTCNWDPRWGGTEEIFEEIKAENFLNVLTSINLQRLDKTKKKKHGENHTKTHHNQVTKDL